MANLQALKEQIILAVEDHTSESVLQQVREILDHNPRMATPAEEAAIAAGIADFEAGNVISLEEFIASGEQLIKELTEKYKDRDARRTI